MFQLPMELRGVDGDGRTIDGVCVPYDEISYLTPNPAGERVMRGAFAKSVAQQAGKVFLFRGHDHAHPIGKAVRFEDRSDGLYGTFQVRRSALGDEALSDVAEGYLPAMSVGFKPVQARRGSNGETEIVEAQLKEVSLLPLGAYEGARVFAMRAAEALHIPTIELSEIDLRPTLPGWLY
jgi:HK97 family phage prohead protease